MTDELNEVKQTDETLKNRKSLAEICGETPPKKESLAKNNETETPATDVYKEDKLKDKNKEKAQDKAIAKNEIANDSLERDISEHPEFKKLKEEVSRAEQRRKGTENSWKELSNKLKAYQKSVKKIMDEGIITEEEGKYLLDEVSHSGMDIEEDGSADESPMQKLFRVADNGIEKIREAVQEGIADEDPLMDKKIRAFNFFLKDATKKEIDKALDDLSKLDEEPIKLAKKLLSIGQKYYEDAYGEYDEVGGLKGFKKKYQDKIEELEKTIDKQNKEILKFREKYEDYTEKSYDRLPNGSIGITAPPKEGRRKLASIVGQ